MAALPATLHQRHERPHPGTTFHPHSSSLATSSSSLSDPRMAAPASTSRVHSPRMSPRISASTARGYASGYPPSNAAAAAASASSAAEEERWANEAAMRKRRLEAGGDPSPQARSRAAAEMEHRYGGSPHRPTANRSPQSRMAMLQEEARMRASGSGGPAGAQGSKLGRNGLPSPHTQLPSFNNLSNAADDAYDADEAAAKRRRLAAEEEEEFMRRRMAEEQQQRAGGAPIGDDGRRGWRAPAPLPRDGPSGVGLYDASNPDNVPLARRRGDAAQAKASRLHIDTSQSPSALDAHAAVHQRHGAPHQPIMARSAPPQKLHFSEREDLLSPYRPPEQGEYAPSGGAGGGPGGPGITPARHFARHSVGGREAYGGIDERRVPSPEGAGRPRGGPDGPRGGPFAAGGFPQPGGPPGSARFMPQTATLPSPAYHTTQFVRGAGAPGGPIAGPSGGAPRTAGLNPPMTARLPEHLRSPPSSKTQFLSLFSNFYDSLSDSRTLKATLEDQVRRSNTLLQTLQKSSRVLESTVERRIRDERNVWEGKIGRLQRRVEELEARLDITNSNGSAQGDDARSAASGEDQLASAPNSGGDGASGDGAAHGANGSSSSGIKRSAPGSDEEASRDTMGVDGRRGSKQQRRGDVGDDGAGEA